MTGKVLYDKHVDALKAAERWQWDSALKRSTRRFPTDIPPAWQYLDPDRRNYYNALAKLVTPRKER
jgi:hypothetical protein